MTKNFVENKAKIRGNKTVFAIALVLILAFSAFMAITPSAKAQAATSTPENWINLITQTPDGAWRPESGVTNYPVLQAPRGDVGNTGYKDGPAPHTNHTLWRASIGFPEWSRIVIQNGVVYACNEMQKALYAFDAYTGQVLWQYDDVSLNGWQTGLANDFLFLKNGSYVIAIGADSGQLVWTSPDLIGSGRMNLVCPMGTVFPADYAVYVYASGGAMTICYKLAPGGGLTKVWNSTKIVSRSDSYYDGKLYGVGVGNKGIACVNAVTGEFLWNYTLPTPDVTYSAYMSVTDGKVFAPVYFNGGAKQNIMFVLDANTGEYLWNYTTEGAFVQLQSVAYGRIYLSGADENKLYCLDETTGELLWTFTAAGMIDYYGPITADGGVYFNTVGYTITGFPPIGTYPGYTYCVNATTGDLVWKYLTPTAGTMVAIADGNLYGFTIFDYLWCWGQGPTTTTAAVTSQSITLGQSTVVSGSVADMSPFSQKHPELQSPLVSGVPVVLSYVKDGAWTDFATVNTASDGTYMSTWNPPSEGAYKVVARFEGTDSYHWSSAQAVVQVSPASPSVTPPPQQGPSTDMYIIAAAAVVIIVVVAVAALVLRKRK